MKDVLEIKGIGKEYIVNGTEKVLLKDINLTIKKGEFVCIVGPSGCGKTTILELLAGFQKPDRGMVIHENKTVLKPEASRIMIFQDFNQLFPWKTVYENIMFPLRKLRKNLQDMKKQELAETALNMVKLKDYGGYYPHQLSGGMKQRAAIARALVLDPEILLMDEPFGSLDAQIRSQLQNLLVDIWKDTGVTVVFVTHDIQEAVLLSERIVIMDGSPGRIKAIVSNEIQRPRNIMESGCRALYEDILKKLDKSE
ncbi:MAG: ABC transporter ATP-binding protein [Clostridiaceae bacterium]